MTSSAVYSFGGTVRPSASEANELSCDFRETFVAPFGPAILDREVITLDPA